MTTESKPRKQRTPRNYESIQKGALELDLRDQVKLVVELKKAIQQKVDEADQAAKDAKETVNGL